MIEHILAGMLGKYWRFTLEMQRLEQEKGISSVHYHAELFNGQSGQKWRSMQCGSIEEAIIDAIMYLKFAGGK